MKKTFRSFMLVSSLSVLVLCIMGISGCYIPDDPIPGKCTGCGWILSAVVIEEEGSSAKANFTFSMEVIDEDGDGDIDISEGQCEYSDHGAGVMIHGELAFGICFDDGAGYTGGDLFGYYEPRRNWDGDGGFFWLRVIDRGEPGVPAGDSIEIMLGGGIYDGYHNYGELERGNVKFHPAE